MDTALFHEVTGLFAAIDPATRASLDTDFGGFTKGAAAAVVRPRTAIDVAKVVSFAKEHALPLTVRGAGRSASGQSIARGGLVLDMTRMDRVATVEPSRATLDVEPGASWAEVVQSASEHGLIPPSLPLHLGMTVGGLLAAGGVGSSSFRHGAVVANVDELDVVTGTGQLVTCSAKENATVFYAVLGGQGLFGVVCRARLRLRRASAEIHTSHRLYRDFPALLAEQRRLATVEGCAHLEAFCWATAKGAFASAHGRGPYTQWMFGLHAGFESKDAMGQALPADAPGEVLGSDRTSALEHTARYAARFEGMQRSGAWSELHPWAEYFAPVEILEDLVPRALQLLPPWLGDGHRLHLVAPGERRGSFMTPKGQLGCFAVLPPGVPRALRDDAVAVVARLDELMFAAGAKRYLAGFLPPFGASGWRRHYEERFAEVVDAKRRLDPANVFTSCFGGPSDE